MIELNSNIRIRYTLNGATILDAHAGEIRLMALNKGSEFLPPIALHGNVVQLEIYPVDAIEYEEPKPKTGARAFFEKYFSGRVND